MNQWSFIDKNKYLLIPLIIIIAGGLFLLYYGGYFKIDDGKIVLDSSLSRNSYEKTATIKGILLNAKTNKPLQIKSLELLEESKNSYAEYNNNNGRFVIHNVKIPANKKISLVLTFMDDQVKPIENIDLNNEEEATYIKKERTYSLKIINVTPPEIKEANPSNYEYSSSNKPEEKVLIAKVKTISGGLNLRKEPSTRSKILTSIPKGAFLKVMGKLEELETVGGLTGYWVFVEYGGKEGYVFDAYLEYEP